MTSGGNNFSDFHENQHTIFRAAGSRQIGTTRNQALHFNKRTVNFYHRLCISLQAYLVERYCNRSPCPDIISGNTNQCSSPSTTPLIRVVICITNYDMPEWKGNLTWKFDSMGTNGRKVAMILHWGHRNWAPKARESKRRGVGIGKGCPPPQPTRGSGERRELPQPPTHFFCIFEAHRTLLVERTVLL